MKSLHKPCIKTVTIQGCMAALLLSACVFVAELVMTRLIQAVRGAPAPAQPAAPLLMTPPTPP